MSKLVAFLTLVCLVLTALWVGLLLALNGAACILGVIGSLAGSALLSPGVMVGGILILAAKFLLAWASWKEAQ